MKTILNKLPKLDQMDKKEILDVLLREEYGFLPMAPYSVTATLETCDTAFCAGKADLQTLTLHCKAEWGEYSFPIYYVCPKKVNAPVPCLYI